MELYTTLGLTVLAAAITALCGWRGALPPDFRKGPRLVPWRFLMVLAASATLILLVHALNLVGFQTGHNQIGQ
jgi:hypothetical protein